MVGTGYMDGKMILSKEALLHGFENTSDKKNTAIHEFTHLIDKRDGVIDGITSALLDKQYVLPWMDYMDKNWMKFLKATPTSTRMAAPTELNFSPSPANISLKDQNY